jgi:hypothetical protein
VRCVVEVLLYSMFRQCQSVLFCSVASLIDCNALKMEKNTSSKTE